MSEAWDGPPLPSAAALQRDHQCPQQPVQLLGALLAYVVWFNGIARLPALAASFLSFASPLCATVLGYLFMGQTLGPLQLLGAAGVVGAVVLAQRGEGAAPGTPPASAAESGRHGDDEEHEHEHGRHDAVSGLRVHPSSLTAPPTGPAPRPVPPPGPGQA
ncbi:MULTISPECIES: DMT family transporter [unclassified Streptomyces]|uniref:DMT family transporter n=1 Tax=unclassified Streptomyces TaxID=2593676 RepID=UPI000AB2FE1A